MAYAYKRSITIDYTKCGTANSTDFPVLVSFTDLNFRTVANGGRVQNASGYDIAFYSNSALTTPLFWEIDQYDASSGATGTCSFWVKVPTLSATANTVIYVAYGDTSISAFQSTASSVWSNGFAAVYHLGNGSTLTANDSTTNANNGTITTANATATTGKIYGCFQGNGLGPEINLGNGSSLNFTGSFTLSTWFMKTGGSTPNGVTLIGKDKDTGGRSYILMCVNSVPQLGIFIGGNGGADSVTSTTRISYSTWYHVVGTWESTTRLMTLYVNGVADGTPSTTTQTSVPTSTCNATLGYREYTGFQGSMIGKQDESRIATVSRSASWVKAEYNNQNSPSTFFTLGTETPVTSSFIANENRQIGIAISRASTY